jgi:hypothetical protein
MGQLCSNRPIRVTAKTLPRPLPWVAAPKCRALMYCRKQLDYLCATTTWDQHITYWMHPSEDGSGLWGRRRGSPVQLIYSVTAYTHTLHGVRSDRNRSDGNDARAASLLFNNKYTSVYETSHVFPKRTTNYDIHNSVGYTGHEGYCPLGYDAM